jgi:hypothetical protein
LKNKSILISREESPECLTNEIFGINQKQRIIYAAKSKYAMNIKKIRVYITELEYLKVRNSGFRKAKRISRVQALWNNMQLSVYRLFSLALPA